jgi:hypothetical protein
VYNDVDDKNVFLKFLYYPGLTSEDLHGLVDKFEDQLRMFNSKKRLTYALASGSVIGTWALAYTYRFKFSSFLFSTVFSFFLVNYGLRNYFSGAMKHNLNSSAEALSTKYPKVKYARVQYTKSSEISHNKLV